MCLNYSTRNSEYIMIIFCDTFFVGFCDRLATTLSSREKKQNSLLNMFSISVMSLCLWKMLLPSTNRYVWVFGRACGILFEYEKLQRSKYRSLGNSAADGPSIRSEKMVNKRTKKLYLWHKNGIFFFFLSEKLMHFISSDKILWPNISKSFWRLIKCIYVFHFSNV